MYLRPMSIAERFLVEEKTTRIDNQGRQIVTFTPTNEEILGVISTIETFEREKFKGTKHEASHGIVQRLGRIKAKPGDRLINGDRKFIVSHIDNPGGLSQYYIYFCNERFD